MERVLKPERFDTEPGKATSEQAWKHWKKTFDYFTDNFTGSNALDDTKKLAALTNCVSPYVFTFISAAEKFTDAINILEGIYVRPRNEVYARHLVSSRKQQDHESVDEFMNALDLLAKDCSFADVTADVYRDEFIRDAFVRGLKSPEIRQRLLEECKKKKDTFDKARTLELSLRNSLAMQNKSYQPQCLSTESHPNDPICDKTQDSVCASTGAFGNSPKPARSNCYFCGNVFHSRSSCPAKDITCYLCGKTGHYAKVCKSSNRQNSGNSKSRNYQSNRQPTAASLQPYALSDSTINVKVNTSSFQALVDSGSTNSFMDKSVAVTLGLHISNENKQTISMAVGSRNSKTLGSVSVKLQISDQCFDKVNFLVLENLCCNLIIGHDILKSYDTLVIKFGGPKPSLRVDNITDSAFACKLSAVKMVDSPPLFEYISPDVMPIACKSRRFSIPDKQFIDLEIQRLLAEGIIEPSISPWRAQVLVANSDNDRHRRRMVVDYSRTINKYTMLDAYPLPNLDELAHKVAQFSVYSSYDLKSAYHQVPIRDSDKPYTAFEASGRLYQFNRIPFGVTNGVAAFQRFMDNVIDSEGALGTFAYLDNITIGGKDQLDHDTKVEKFEAIVSKYGLTLNHDKTISSVQELKMLGYLISHGQIKPDPDRMRPLLDLPVPTDSASLKRAMGLFSYYSQWVPQYSDKIQPLISLDSFPLSEKAIASFELVKRCVSEACIVSPNLTDPLVIETDASGYALSASLNQNGKPVAFFSRTLNKHEKLHSSIEKEACAIVEAVRKWRHYLTNRKFILVTDQQAVSFLFSKNNTKGTAKNEKIMRWRVELSCLDFDIKFRPGKLNSTADCLSRVVCAALSHSDLLHDIHEALCHPGVVRLGHYIRTHNLPYSMEDVKRVTSNCRICAELKPAFFKPNNPPLVKAVKPFERLSMDFKGPLPSNTKNKYMLTVVDEYSRFPFAFPCPDMSAPTVKNKLIELFSVFGGPDFIHSDRGKQFLSETVKSFLLASGIGSSHSSPYNPRGNGQCERYNGIIWRAVQLALRSKDLDISQWEAVLPEALHSIRSLLCTATNDTPHNRLFNFPRKSSGSPLPSWLQERGRVLLRKHVKQSKYDDLCDEVELVDSNPTYARVRLQNGVEKNVSLRDLAPLPNPRTLEVTPPIAPSHQESHNSSLESATDPIDIAPFSEPVVTSPVPVSPPATSCNPTVESSPEESFKRMSQRRSQPPERLNYDKLGGD